MLQVLKRRYGPEADLWSCGVILYILLSGVPPFWGDTEQQIFDSILKGKIDFKTDPWPKISRGAKDAVTAMLSSVRNSFTQENPTLWKIPQNWLFQYRSLGLSQREWQNLSNKVQCQNLIVKNWSFSFFHKETWVS